MVSKWIKQQQHIDSLKTKKELKKEIKEAKKETPKKSKLE
jgi:hypothetical protein|tara:strand:- start:18302 stop:18421 length:120 start_codon:yes stop_codon:yes gene_type:complete